MPGEIENLLISKIIPQGKVKLKCKIAFMS